MLHLRRSLWLGCTLFLLAGATSALARQAVIITNDGKRLTGEVVGDSGDTVTLLIANVRTPIARDKIKEVQYIESIAEQYERRRALLNEDDVKGRANLAYWLMEQRAYDLATKELTDLDAKYPNSPERQRVQLLIRAVQDRIRIDEEATRKPDDSTTKPAVDNTAKVKPTPGRKSASAQVGDENRLTEQQINLIRVYELDMAARPKVAVPREAVDALWEQYRNNDAMKGVTQPQLRSMAPQQLVQLIFNLKARGLYSKIMVREDPPALMDFRKKIHQRYVMNYCGTTDCHGGADAQDMVLIRREPSSDRTVYSNFFILDSYVGRNGLMIDRSAPEDSLLVQFGLPRENASMPHPAVKNLRPAFKVDFRSDQAYEDLLAWVRSLYSPRPEYGVSYTAPPAAPPAAAGAPAAAPAAVAPGQASGH